MFSVLREECHVGYSREFVGTVYCTYGQSNTTNVFLYGLLVFILLIAGNFQRRLQLARLMSIFVQMENASLLSTNVIGSLSVLTGVTRTGERRVQVRFKNK